MVVLEGSYSELKDLFGGDVVEPDFAHKARRFSQHILMGNPMRGVESANARPTLVEQSKKGDCKAGVATALRMSANGNQGLVIDPDGELFCRHGKKLLNE